MGHLAVWQRAPFRKSFSASRRHSLHFDRAHDDKVWSDVIVLELEGGELTTLTMDEFSILRRVE